MNGHPASVIAEDQTWGLIALRVYKEDFLALPFDMKTPRYEGTVTVIGDKTVTSKTGRALRAPKASDHTEKQWMILTGIDGRCAGAPVFAGDVLVGLVVGRSQRDSREVITADVTLLQTLVKQIVGDRHR